MKNSTDITKPFPKHIVGDTRRLLAQHELVEYIRMSPNLQAVTLKLAVARMLLTVNEPDLAKKVWSVKL